jgi:hypothetical protein
MMLIAIARVLHCVINQQVNILLIGNMLSMGSLAN